MNINVIIILLFKIFAIPAQIISLNKQIFYLIIRNIIFLMHSKKYMYLKIKVLS